MNPQARFSPEVNRRLPHSPRPYSPPPSGLRRFRRTVVDLSLIIVTLGTLALYLIGWGILIYWMTSW